MCSVSQAMTRLQFLKSRNENVIFHKYFSDKQISQENTCNGVLFSHMVANTLKATKEIKFKS